MVDAAILSAILTQTLRILGSLALEEVRSLLGVEKQVVLLKDELESMISFLNVAATKQAPDEIERIRTSKIRELAQEAQDVIETFVLKVNTSRKYLSSPKYLYRLHKIGGKIKFINERLQKAKNVGQDYGSPAGNNKKSTTRSEYVEWQRQLSLRQENKHPVGLEKDMGKIEKLISAENKGLSIVNIAGMGGIGKSTLAREVYDAYAADTNRFDCCARICVSSEFNHREILMELLKQLTGSYPEMPKEVAERSQPKLLTKMLQSHLQSRQYFIVLDDVWDITHWQFLQCAFPNNQGKASRLLLTSRKRDIAGPHGLIHLMEPLDGENSERLLMRKAFPRGFHRNRDKIPEELEGVGKKILERCNGLPLAITVVAEEMLAGKPPSTDEWNNVLRDLEDTVGSDTIETTMELSYRNLSPELKLCFLCLGFFNEGVPIHAEKLVQVWIAEGLVLVPHGQQRTEEEIARGYLEDLINQNMVQVTEITVDGKVKKCGIQNFLLKLSTKKAMEEISFEIRRRKNCQSLQKPRHRSIYCSTESFVYKMDKNKRLRTLFVHGLVDVKGSPPKWKKFKLLRVLDLENFGMENLPSAIGTLIGLRYLGLRNNKLKRLPRSLHRLTKLEVLDIALNHMVEFPHVIWKMESLRHLYMSTINCEKPLEIDMTNLQTLLYIPVAYWKAETMTSLRKLGIELDEKSNVSELFSSLAKLENLVHLNLKWSHAGGIAFLDGLNSLQNVTKLKLRGRLTTLPDFPPNLNCLSLVHTNLSEDPMPILERLEKLRSLKLHGAYTGDRLGISDYGFVSLEVLSLRELVRLKNLEVRRWALRALERLEINSCFHLVSLPEQVSAMWKLQVLKMVTTRDIAIKLKGVDSYKISKIRSVNIIEI